MLPGIMLPRSVRAAALRITFLAISASALTVAQAQEPGEQAGLGRGAFAGMQRAQGEVTAVSGLTLTLKDADGSLTTVVTTTNTRIMTSKMAPEKVADIKVGDGAMAMGQLDAPNKTLHAAMLFTTDAAQIKAMKENLGKTYIAGKVTAIDLDNAKMTVERPDKVSQTIQLDESTSFKKGRGGPGGGMGMGGGTAASAPATPSSESITLADIKVGDGIYATGAVKSGAFVPAQVIVSPPRGTHAKPADDAAAGK